MRVRGGNVSEQGMVFVGIAGGGIEEVEIRCSLAHPSGPSQSRFQNPRGRRLRYHGDFTLERGIGILKSNSHHIGLNDEGECM